MALAHSILINFAIKLELDNFLLPPLLSIVFVWRMFTCLQVFDEGRLERSTICLKNGKPGYEFVKRIKD